MYRFEIGPILTTPPKRTTAPTFATSTRDPPITAAYTFENTSLHNEVI